MEKQTCLKCKQSYDAVQFQKITTLKTCKTCLETGTKQRKKENKKDKPDNSTEKKKRVSLQKVYEYLKSKYNIKEELDEIIENIEE
jgi:cyclophilin family peptidyl-prolyl cis-trans isomerase